MSKWIKKALIPVMMALMAISAIVAPALAGGGDNPPAGWCATGPRDPNPDWQIVDHPSALPNPGCSSDTRYVMSLNGQNYSASWNNLENLRNGQNATYYNEWVGGGNNGGNNASAPPSDFCKLPYGSNHGWSIGAGEHAWNACKGLKGAWSFQPNGTGTPMGHLTPKSFKQLENWRANHGYQKGTYWFDRLQPKPAGFCNGTAGWHMPTGVTVSGSLCGSNWIVKYKLTVKVPGHAEHVYTGSLKHVFYLRRCQDHSYEATLWVVSKKRVHNPCGCG